LASANATIRDNPGATMMSLSVADEISKRRASSEATVNNRGVVEPKDDI
jgi:hypothetical protein